MELREAAHAYADLGWGVFPVAPGAKDPLVKWRDASSIDHGQIDAWWGRWPDANIGIDCGFSDLVVVDVDDRGSIELMVDDLGVRVDEVGTLRADTPRGGMHVYFQAGDEPIRNSQSALAPKVDVRGDGGYVLAAPSVTEDGVYSWANSGHPVPMLDRLAYACARPAWEPAADTYEPAPDPPPADSMAARWAEAALNGEVDAVAAAPDGTRNARLFEAGLKLYGIVKGGHLDGPTVTSILMSVGVDRAGQSRHEADHTLRSAWERSISRGPDDWRETARLVDPPRLDGPDDGEPGFQVLNLSQLADLPAPRWVLENRIPEGLTWLIGHPKVGKSFIALDWAATVAAGGQRVLYMAGEGVHGFAKRVLAWADAHPGATLDTLGVVPTVPRLLDPASVATFYRTLRRFRPDLVVVDTWSRATPGANENDHGDMSLAIDHIDKARDAYGCSVMVVHHTNVSGVRARGHTSLEGAADAIWHVKRDSAAPDVIEVVNDAVKDWQTIPSLMARLNSQSDSAVLAPSAHDRPGWA